MYTLDSMAKGRNSTEILLVLITTPIKNLPLAQNLPPYTIVTNQPLVAIIRLGPLEHIG